MRRSVKIGIVGFTLIMGLSLAGCEKGEDLPAPSASEGESGSSVSPIAPSPTATATGGGVVLKPGEGLVDQIPPTFGVKIGESYTTALRWRAKDRPDSVAMTAALLTRTDRAYQVTEQVEEYVKIEADGMSGWLPAWYLTEAARQVMGISPERLMLVPKAGRPLFLYPESSAPSEELPLEGGRVVKVVAEYRDWAMVEFRLYDAGEYGNRWMNKADLADYSASAAREGTLRYNGKFYDPQGQPLKEGTSSSLMIQEEVSLAGKGDFYRVSGPGGFSALIKRADFVPDPFRLPGKEPENTLKVQVKGEEKTWTLPEGILASEQETKGEMKRLYSLRDAGTGEVLGTWKEITSGQVDDRYDEAGRWIGTSNEGEKLISPLGNGHLFLQLITRSAEEQGMERPEASITALLPRREGHPGYAVQLDVPYGKEPGAYVQAVKKMLHAD
ncbi:hypothetical protein [Gorillibacterium sp. CAU 1737]|uniref:hypothetical protein n=1 Tax=Gorillibacterium sp. CAU 1737 TaxID=3140362 RepID=UPI0032609809